MRGILREEISLTPESALIACRRFFGERGEVPWSFKGLTGFGTFTSVTTSNRFVARLLEMENRDKKNDEERPM